MTRAITIHVPEYEHARSMRDMNEKPLSNYSASDLAGLIKDRSIHAQAAAVILLHDCYKKSELPRHFTDVEIQRYFAHL